MTTHSKSRAPRLTCALCGGPVEETGRGYRCLKDGSTWDRSETGLLVRHYDRFGWKRPRDRKSGKFLSQEVSR